jgi:hypothetical protein
MKIRLLLDPASYRMRLSLRKEYEAGLATRLPCSPK